MPIVHEEMSTHLDLIRQGMQGFSLARSKIRAAFTRSRESDETAEMVIHQFLDNMFPGAQARDLFSRMDQLVNQYHSYVAPEAVMVCDDDDVRSMTMGVEPGSSSNHHHGTSCMGPPPRPAALLTSVTLAGPKDNMQHGAYELPPVRDDPEYLSSDTSHGCLTLLQTAERPLDVVEIDEPRTPELPSKKTKGSTAPHLDSLVTKSVDFREVEGRQLIFVDRRYGPGWFVLRCGPGQQKPFLKHPLRGNVAMDHFASEGHTCHDTNRIYTLEDVLIENTYRGEKNPFMADGPSGGPGLTLHPP